VKAGKARTAEIRKAFCGQALNAVYISLPLLTERNSFARRVKGWDRWKMLESKQPLDDFI